MPNSNQAAIRLKLTNGLTIPRRVVLEPWAGEYTLHPGKSFEIVAEGDMKEPLEVEILEDTVVVYALNSVGAMLSIFQDGTELLRSE